MDPENLAGGLLEYVPDPAQQRMYEAVTKLANTARFMLWAAWLVAFFVIGWMSA